MNQFSQATGRTFGRRSDFTQPALEGEPQPSGFLDDVRLFATGWLGGLVFFGTFLA